MKTGGERHFTGASKWNLNRRLILLAKKKTKNKPNSIKRLIIYCLILSLLTILTPVEIHVLVWFTKQYFFRSSEFLSILSITMYLNICFCLCYLAKRLFYSSVSISVSHEVILTINVSVFVLQMFPYQAFRWYPAIMKNAEYNFMMKSDVQHVMAAQFYSSRTLLLDSLDGIFDMIQVYSLVWSVLLFAALRHCVLPEIGSLYRWYTVCRMSAGCCQQQWYVTVIHTTKGQKKNLITNIIIPCSHFLSSHWIRAYS